MFFAAAALRLLGNLTIVLIAFLLITHHSSLITPTYAQTSGNGMSITVSPSSVAFGQNTTISVRVFDSNNNSINANVTLKIYHHDKNSAVTTQSGSTNGDKFNYVWQAQQDPTGDTNNETWTVGAWSDQTSQYTSDNPKTQSFTVTPAGSGTQPSPTPGPGAQQPSPSPGQPVIGGGTTPADFSYTPHLHTGFTLENVASNLVGCWVIGAALVPGGGAAAGCPDFDQNGNLKSYSYLPNGGALGGITKVMVALYNKPPASSTQYLADLATQMGLVKPALAQTQGTPFGVGGSGDQVIVPILALWKVMRNLAYLFFIVIFVLVGLMIMFRRKINPQTVISVQSALPSLVIGLILVTFSYFIASLIIDLSFVGMKLVGFIFQQSGLKNIIVEGNGATIVGVNLQTSSINQLSTNGNIFQLWWSFIANDSLRSNIIAPLASYFNVTPTLNQFFNVSSNSGGPFGITINPVSLLTSVAGYITGGVGAIGGFLISVVIIVALLVQMFRLLWALVSAYITIIIFAIAGPLLIAAGSIPGRGALITYWWKGLIANVLIFPAVFFVFLFAGVFLQSDNVGSFTHGLPLFEGLSYGILPVIIGYGLALGSPAVPGLVKNALGVKDITAVQQAAFQGLGSGFSPFSKAGAKIWEPRKREAEAMREGLLRRKAESITQQQLSQQSIFHRAANALYGVPKGDVNPRTTQQTPVSRPSGGG